MTTQNRALLYGVVAGAALYFQIKAKGSGVSEIAEDLAIGVGAVLEKKIEEVRGKQTELRENTEGAGI